MLNMSLVRHSVTLVKPNVRGGPYRRIDRASLTLTPAFRQNEHLQMI